MGEGLGRGPPLGGRAHRGENHVGGIGRDRRQQAHEGPAEGEGAERTEFYAVAFAAGVTLNWGIGGVVDGKYTVAFAQNG